MKRTSKPDPTLPEQPIPQPAPVLPGDPIVEPGEPVTLPAPPQDPLEPDPMDPKPVKLPGQSPDQA